MFQIIYQSICFLKPYVLNCFNFVSTNESVININALLFIMEGGWERERIFCEFLKLCLYIKYVSLPS